jgi:anti-sigma factor RsiW
MRHPSEGTLRRLVDEPAGVADSEREHVAGCPQCTAGLAAAREDADFVDAALAVDTEVDVDAAWRRLTAASPRKTGRFRALLRRPAVAGIAAALVLGGAGVAAASGWLEIFQTEEIAPVGIQAGDLVAVPDLDA